jgi:hypothetical protein
MTLVTDTWPEEEAFGEVLTLRELLEEGNDEDYLAKDVLKTRKHWETVFDSADDLTRFIIEFNRQVTLFDDSVTSNPSMFLMEY